jgi:hypothetical protein
MKKGQLFAILILVVMLASFVAHAKWGGVPLGFSDGR